MIHNINEMVDIWKEFNLSATNAALNSPKRATKHINAYMFDEFIKKAFGLLSSLISFEKLIGRIFENYVGYHRHVTPFSIAGSETAILSNYDCKEFDQQIGLFIANFISELNILRECISRHETMAKASCHQMNHYNEIINFLYSRLNVFMRTTKLMQSEKEVFNANPFRLNHINVKFNNYGYSKLAKNKPVDIKTFHTQQTIDRYESEIASVTKMKEYESISIKYKDLLLKEAKGLQNKYNEDVRIVQQVEESIEQISSMLSEFVRILNTQTDHVEDIFDQGEATVSSVSKSNQELQTTIDRSRSNQWNMIALTWALIILLLILDAITP